MLVIRNAQMNVFRDSAEAACIATLEQCLRESFPADFARLSGDDVGAVVRLGMARSRAHGGTTTPDMYLYLTMMFMLGCHFDEDPQLAWAQDMLDQNETVARLHEEALHYLDAVAGPENEHLIKALARVRRLELALLPDADAHDFEPRMLTLLRTIYPTKFDMQSDIANRQVTELGKSLAGRHSMPGAGAALLALLAFLLGASFDRDPLHLWIQTVLRHPGGMPKVQELHRRGLEFVEIALR